MKNRRIDRVSPKAYEYVKRVLDYGFHNAQSVGINGQLEQRFAETFGQKHGITHCNGTATMQSALMASGVGVGDEVIVPAFTVFSTSAAILHCNAIPVIADVDPVSWTISPESIRDKISARTKAIIPVAICGLPPDMDSIMQISEQNNLTVIEDNAQCILGYYKEQVAGSMGHFASFSFQASKTLTCGDGGILICSDDELALKARKAATLGFKDIALKPGKGVVPENLRCHPDYKRHESIGWNQRVPEIAAAVALAELERVEELARMRTYSAMAFDQVVKDCSWLIPQYTGTDYINAYWAYAMKIDRDDIAWSELLGKFKSLGGDGFYGAYQPAYLEPVFSNLYAAVLSSPERYPHYAGVLPNYELGCCPIWEKIQPRIIMLKTNYYDCEEADLQAEILQRTIANFS